MSELGDTYHAMNEAGKEKRYRNKLRSEDILDGKGISYTAKNEA